MLAAGAMSALAGYEAAAHLDTDAFTVLRDFVNVCRPDAVRHFFYGVIVHRLPSQRHYYGH